LAGEEMRKSMSRFIVIKTRIINLQINFERKKLMKANGQNDLIMHACSTKQAWGFDGINLTIY
jgi:hypothetical protein